MSLLAHDTYGEPKKPLIPFIVIHTLIFLLFFIVLSQLFYFGPGALELDFAENMLKGLVPYRDFPSEYPPLALFAFILPALILSTYPAYSVAYAAEMLLFDVAVMFFVTDLASYLKISAKRALGVYTLLLIAIGPIIVARFDMLPAVLVIAAIWAFIRGKNLTAFLLLGFGVTTKLYPVIIVPPMAFYLLRRRQFSRLIKGGIAFAVTLIILNLPFIILSPGGYLNSFLYHTQRGLQCESIYASIVLIGKVLGKVKVEGVFSYGSWNITSPLADGFARASFFITVILLLAAYAHYARVMGRMPKDNLITKGISATEAKILIGYSSLVIIIFIIANKVFSPQYLIWLLPLLPLINTKWSNIGWLIFVIAGVITQYIFPYKYLDYERFETLYVLVLAFRNILILALMVLIVLATATSKTKLKAEPKSTRTL